LHFPPGIPGLRLSQLLLKSFPDVLYGILLHCLVQSIPEQFGQSFCILSCLILFGHTTPPIELITFLNLKRSQHNQLYLDILTVNNSFQAIIPQLLIYNNHTLLSLSSNENNCLFP
jgi:hypothetical protein